MPPRRGPAGEKRRLWILVLSTPPADAIGLSFRGLSDPVLSGRDVSPPGRRFASAGGSLSDGWLTISAIAPPVHLPDVGPVRDPVRSGHGSGPGEPAAGRGRGPSRHDGRRGHDQGPGPG